MKPLLLGLVLSLLFTVQTATAEELIFGVSEAEAELRVGCLYPLTGAAALWGRDAAAGIEMALDHVSKSYPQVPRMRVYIADTMGKQYRSREIVQQLLQQRKVDVLCGVVNSNIALETSRLAKENQTLFLGAGHSTSRVSEEELHPWYFHLNNDARQSMYAGALYLKELQQKSGWKTIAYIGPDYEYGHQIWQQLTKSLDRLGVKYKVTDEYYSLLNETDYAAYIEAFSGQPSDILVNGHWTRDLVRFIEQANNARLFEKTQFVNFDTGGGYFVLDRLKDVLPENLVLSGRHHVNWPRTDRNMAYVAEFERRNKRLPTFVAQGAYSVFIALAEAWQQAPKKDMASIRQTLEGLKLSLPEDPEGFQSWIDAETHQIMQVQAIGETRVVLANEDGAHGPVRNIRLNNWSVYYPADLAIEKPLNGRETRTD